MTEALWRKDATKRAGNEGKDNTTGRVSLLRSEEGTGTPNNKPTHAYYELNTNELNETAGG